MQRERESFSNVSADYLTLLAKATTRYFETSPDLQEAARQQYLVALTQFNGALSAGTRSESAAPALPPIAGN